MKGTSINNPFDLSKADYTIQDRNSVADAGDLS